MLLGQHALLMILCVFFFLGIFFFLSFFFSTKSYNIKYINTEGNSFGIHNLCFGFFSSFLWCAITLSPCWSLLEFWKIKLEKSISMNWIFSLQKWISKLIFAGYQIRNRLKIQFVELDFSKLIFQKSSTDQQGVCLLLYCTKSHGFMTNIDYHTRSTVATRTCSMEEITILIWSIISVEAWLHKSIFLQREKEKKTAVKCHSRFDFR